MATTNNAANLDFSDLTGEDEVLEGEGQGNTSSQNEGKIERRLFVVS